MGGIASRILRANEVASRIRPAAQVASFMVVAPFEAPGLRQLAASVSVSAGVWATLTVPATAGLAASVSVAPLVNSALTSLRQLAAAPTVVPSVNATLRSPRPLAAAMALAPSVAVALANPRALAAAVSVAPAVTALLRNPRALAAALGVAPNVAATLRNPRALAAALGVAPNVAAALVNARQLAAAAGVAANVTAALTSGVTYSPVSEGNLVGWFSLVNSSDYAQSGGFVDSVTDLVSGTVVSEATNKPAYQATGLNSLPACDHDGTNDRFIGTIPAIVNALQDSNAWTIYVVGQSDTPDSTNVWFGWGNSAQATASSGGVGYSTTSTGKYATYQRYASDATNNDESAGASDTNPHVIAYVHTTTTVSIQVDNGAADPAAASAVYTTTTPNRFAIGCNPRSTPTQFVNGRWREILIFAAAHDAAAVGRVSNYLGPRSGISVAP